MFKIIAAGYEDGYAFVQDRDSIYLIRPPYTKKDKQPATLSIVERAIATHGFMVEDKAFDSWESLIMHLMTQLVEERKEAHRDEPDPERIRRMFKWADKGKVEEYLGRIENELIPGHNWKPAISLLEVFLENKSVLADSFLNQRCEYLRNHCEAASRKEVVDDQEEIMLVMFARAIKRYTRKVILWNDMVRKEGQIIQAGSN